MSLGLILLSVVCGLMLLWLLLDETKRLREEKRGWRLWVRAPFFSYQEKDSNGTWSGIRFDATWEYSGHSSILKTVRLRSDTDWFREPEWATSRRDIIIRHLKAAYPRVEFLEGPPEPTPLTVTDRVANTPSLPPSRVI